MLNARTAVSVLVLAATWRTVAHAASECVWIGGGSGDVFEASNWYPAHVPSSPGTTAYVAVFTNSVTLAASQTYWYPAGIVVSNGATVAYSQNRITPTKVCEDAEFRVRVESGSSLSFGSPVIFYGSSSLTFVKTGGGAFSVYNWFGNPNAEGVWWNAVDVQGGTLLLPSREGFACVGGQVRVRAGATVRINAGNAFAASETMGLSQPLMVVDEGGVLDANGKSFTVSALSGAGVVTNCSGTLTMNLRNSGETFAGRIVGGGTLKIAASATLTPASAVWTAGAFDSLWGVSLNRASAGDCSVRFAAGIGTFYAAEVPTDAPCYDTDGVPVEIAPAGNFWYIDGSRTGASGDGRSPASAFKTLKDAMENPELAANDTVFVAPGQYDSDTMEAVQGAYTTRCRMKVPANVRVVATGSAADTAIVGENAASPVQDGYGMGEDSVRCVILEANSTLRGFTLRGGRAFATSKSAPTSDAGYGGGIYAAGTAVIIDCVISNCVAVRGGGAHQGSYFGCRFHANRATAGDMIGSHLMQQARLYNCVLTGGLGACDWYANQTDSLALNCTFGPNAKGGVRGLGAESEKHVKVVNCLVMAAPARGAADEYRACIVSPRGEAVDVVFGSDCTVTNLTTSTSPTVYGFAGVCADSLRPRTAGSRLLGAADLEAYRALFPVAQHWLSVRDADGGRRVWGDALDIGAFAYDRNRPLPGMTVILR